MVTCVYRASSISELNRQLRIGLTGGIASGKSTVAQRFRDLGVALIDADESARSVVAPGTPGLEAVTEAFGSAVLTSSGELDRRELRNIVFSNPLDRRRLEEILHPLIRTDMEARAQASTGPYLVMVIPLLIESGLSGRRIDRVLVVDVAEDIQLARVMARDGTTLDQARAILAAQTSRAARLGAADDVLVNSGSVSDLRHAVDELHRMYLEISAAWAPERGE